MKVLYIGVYRDHTGWGQHAINNILALDSAGVDVVPRAIKLNNESGELPRRIVELEEKPTSGITHVVQHILPSMMEWDSRAKQVALINVESTNFRRIGWAKHLNLMDSVIVPCPFNKNVCTNSGVKKPVYIVPTAIDAAKFNREYPLLDDLKSYIGDDFTFYHISSGENRKNLQALLRAFHTEFHPNEPVQLVLKVGRNIDQLLRIVRDGLKLRPVHKYKKEIIISDRLDENHIQGLHQHLDCFVTSSNSEAICLPLLDAQGHKSLVVAPSHSGIGFYLSPDVGFLVDWVESPCYGGTDNIDNLYTADEDWFPCLISSLRKQMRAAYMSSMADRQARTDRGVMDIASLSLEKIGEKLEEALNG